MADKGLFITLEGGEGVGKTTQIGLLKDKLEQAGHDVVLTREPGGTPFGEQIRNIIINESVGQDMNPTAELLLFFAARSVHIEKVIKPALAAGKVIICDRFMDSAYVYQGMMQKQDMNFIHQLKEQTVGEYMPHLTLLLDISAEKALERVQERGVRDRNDQESLAFYQELRDGFLALAEKEPDRIKVVNADDTIETIAENIWQMVQNIIEN